MTLALHLYQSPMDNESRLLRMARSLRELSPLLEIRLVGLQVDQRGGLEPVDERVTVDRVGSPEPKHDTLSSRFQKVGGWYQQVYRAYRDEPVAVVSAHSVFALPLAFALSRSTGAPVVYNPHELETRTPSMVGVKRVLAEAIERVDLRLTYAPPGLDLPAAVNADALLAISTWAYRAPRAAIYEKVTEAVREPGATTRDALARVASWYRVKYWPASPEWDGDPISLTRRYVACYGGNRDERTPDDGHQDH